MKSPVVAVEMESSLAEAARIMSDNRVSGLLVTDHRGAGIGVVALSDLVAHLAGLDRPPGEPGGFYRQAVPSYSDGGDDAPDEDWSDREVEPLRDTPVSEIMSTELITVGTETPLPAVARTMAEKRIHRIFVVNEKGAPVGVISTLDLLSAATDLPAAKAA
jgi:CBS domain-containing protein